MKKWTAAAVTFGAVIGGLALAATASANHGANGTMLGGKDSGRMELGLEKGDGGKFELNAVEKGDGGKFDLDAVEKGDGGGKLELSTFAHGKKDGG